MVAGYALRRHARGEEDGAQQSALSSGIDLTSWYAILAAASAPRGRQADRRRTRTLRALSALARDWEDRAGQCDSSDTAQTLRQCASELRETVRKVHELTAPPDAEDGPRAFSAVAPTSGPAQAGACGCLGRWTATCAPGTWPFR
jgi:hypothetical protein